MKPDDVAKLPTPIADSISSVGTPLLLKFMTVEQDRAALIEALELAMMVLSCNASKDYIQHGLDVGEETLAAVKGREHG